MKYFLIAGEASGDLHGANLLKALKKRSPGAAYAFWGGDLMAAEAPGLLKHYRDVTIMGFTEVLMNLRKIIGNLELCKKHIIAEKPDAVILIDYPGFNLRIAEFCKARGIKVVYYIAPKVWAWKENRAKKLEKFVDELLLIFPFEVEYFKKWKVKSTYIGNPLMDELNGFKADPHFREQNVLLQKPIIALLPGSRKQEVSKMLPLMLEATSSYRDHQLVIAGAPGLHPSFYEPWLNDRLRIVFGKTYALLAESDAAIVCSGTATLETAILNIPQVCGYVAGNISMFIAKMFVKIKFISLVNLCLNRPAITELIQQEVNAVTLAKELDAIMPGGARREKMLEDYKELRDLLGGAGASERAAAIIAGNSQP